MNKILLAFFIATLAGVSLYLATEQQEEKLESKYPIQSGEGLNIMLIGDWGTGEDPQKIVAEKMNEIAGQKKSQMVLNLGDNFYGQGVSGLDDPQWQEKYVDVYQTKEHLNIPWNGVLGNHDYGGVGLFSQFEYKENNWRIDDFFWAHTAQVGDKSIAFLHMDTTFLSYGPNTDHEQMRQYFQEMNWQKDDDVLALAEELLILYNDYDYVIAMGHAHIGGVCYPTRSTWKLFNLIKKYKVSAWFNGHAHNLAFKIVDDIGMILSGAGAYYRTNECITSLPTWSKALSYGFFNIEILEDEIEVQAYYIDKDFENGWKIKNLPSIPRRERF